MTAYKNRLRRKRARQGAKKKKVRRKRAAKRR